MSVVQFRNSERQAFTTCPQKWWWAYVECLKAKDATNALRFGTLIHSALEAYYLPGLKRGPHPAHTFEQLYEAQLAEGYARGMYDEDGEWHEMRDLGVAMLNGYIDLYGKDTRWYVVGTEAPFRVPTLDSETGIEFVVVGVVDGLWADRSSPRRKRTKARLAVPYRDLYVGDHKTTKDDPTKKADVLVMDDQSGTYWSYGVDYYRKVGILAAGERPAGMLYNFLRKGMPDERPRNAEGLSLNQPTKDDLLHYYEITGRELPPPSKRSLTKDDLVADLGRRKAELLGQPSKTQPTPLFHREYIMRYEFDGQMVRSRTEVQARIMHYMRAGKIPVYKVPGTLHSPHCKWCEFKHMCQLHEQGQDFDLLRRAEFTTWEPYAQHEIMEGR